MKKVLLLTIMLSTLLFTGCMKPVQKPIIENINTNETAFLITLEGDAKGQAKFDSVDYLEKAKVAAKRIEIPTRWLKTGRFEHQGEWIPVHQLIKVNRTPVARRWTAEADTGTSTNKQLLEAESKDSIGVSSGFAITASVKEPDTATFLYWYPNSDLASIVDNQIFNDIQAVYSEVAAKYDVTELRTRKEEINIRIREIVIPKYAEAGITISDSIGLIGGLVYDNMKIQEAIDNVFIAQNLEGQRTAELKGQEVENKRLLSIEETEASKRKIKADAEAYEITVKTEAIAAGGEAYLKVRSLEVLAEAVVKWSGQVPTTFAGGGTQLQHLMLNK
jgi:hypothetical protein